MLMNELDNSRPITYAGRNAQNEGHRFVMDGYDATNPAQVLYHLNYG